MGSDCWCQLLLLCSCCEGELLLQQLGARILGRSTGSKHSLFLRLLLCWQVGPATTAPASFAGSLQAVQVLQPLEL